MKITGPNWRKHFGKTEVIQRIRPEYTNDRLLNPHKGTTTFQRFEGDPLYKDLSWNDKEGPVWFKPPRKKILPVSHYPATTISYCRWSWADMEPEEGKIRFDILEGAIEAARLRKQTLQIRVQPYVGDNGPQWLWKKGISKDKKAKPFKDGSLRWDHNHPLYIKYWCKHITLLGKKLDGNPNLESVDLALGGPCGETGGNLTYENCLVIIDAYTKAFKRTPLISLLNKKTGLYTNQIKNRVIGWRQDCFGDLRGDVYHLGGVPEHLCYRHMYDVYPQKIELNQAKETWKSAPVTMETCWTPAYWYQQGWDIDWIIEHGYKYHLSVFMPKSVYIPDKWADKMEAFNKKMGYRFHILQMIMPLEGKTNQKISVETVIDNKGVAPIYRPYSFAIKFKQKNLEVVCPFKYDIRKWLPDYTYFNETIKIPSTLKKGYAEISCAIVDNDMKPVVKFAIKDTDRQGWSHLSCMDII